MIIGFIKTSVKIAGWRNANLYVSNKTFIPLHRNKSNDKIKLEI